MERGHGLESIFGELFCSVFPLIKKYAPVIGQKALQMDVRIANVVAEAQSLKNAAKTRLFGALEEGINNFVPQAEGQSGLGNQKNGLIVILLAASKQKGREGNLTYFYDVTRKFVFVHLCQE